MLLWFQHRWTGLYLLIMGLGALIMFLYGFFPLKYQSGKLAHMDDLPNFIDGISIDGQQVYNSGENTVILMVIDGLRYDFVTEEHMPYTGQLLKNKSACIYVSVAEPPTVTMPRIKAMMTGSVSTFADVALNFGAPAVRGDSVLRVASDRGRRSVLYGDDTWLRLFPGLWAEHDGTTSFYVTDYTEVDNNVTRHLDKILTPDEKKKPTFDFLVLHYLGLDHIGHLEGARSPKIKPKLLEMDEVVKKIFTSMKLRDRTGVLFVCGDHGMRDAGGHGGATPAEILVPLVLAKSDDFECPHPAGPGPVVEQVDLAPTISWLLNAPPPGDNTGRILPALLPSDMRQHLYLLHVIAENNAKRNGLPTNTEFYNQFVRAEKQFAHYLVTGQNSAAKISKEFYEQSLEEMAKYLADTTVDFDMFAIAVAILLIYFITTALLCLTLYSLQPEFRHKNSISRHDLHRSNAGVVLAFLFVLAMVCSILVLACFISETKSQICSFDSYWIIVFLSIACAYTVAYFMNKTGYERIENLSSLAYLNVTDYLLIGGTVFHSWSFFGTSFIEEEHMTWYFFWNTLMFFVLIRTIIVVVMYLSMKMSGATEVQEKPELEAKMSTVGIDILPKWVLLIALHRYLRTMNQTGDRWLFLPDTADWLNAPENSFYLQLHLIIGTFATLAICLYNLRHMNNFLHIHTALTIAATAAILFYRIATQALNWPLEDVKTWNPVDIVTVFWAILIVQFIFEILTYIGLFKSCGLKTTNALESNKFVYNKPKAKTEDYFYDSTIEEPWNIDEVKLNLARSVSHIMLNDMMLIIILLMRPHNVIMVPSVYVTCALTSKCMNHNLLDSKLDRRTEVVDILSRTLVHMWIGVVFFFYQGNSNSLASVDLGSGYVGLSEYCPLRVSLRMGLHAYAGPALAGAALFCTTATSAHYLGTVRIALSYYNSNSLASVDLGSGYVGLSEYCPLRVSLRMGLHAYAGPALAGAALFCTTATSAHTWEQYLQTIWRTTNILALHRVYAVVVYLFVATIFRHHLFVWSVFSPKLLYDFVATVFTVQALSTIAQIVGLTHLTSRIARVFTRKMR
ncbi:GPI ethanolamine phosphate transferase 2 isoform X2 [Manduca sexta]|uniref:GPI ethanolamine phosphate transferase 2 isoform X2 n=1 Tax=Manduca sexta TaxID=7130 RepID=UPI00188E0594|nr:GPI ethanolamine phosphate transferase 2 isoform X2 [Manduca sexta]